MVAIDKEKLEQYVLTDSPEVPKWVKDAVVIAKYIQEELGMDKALTPLVGPRILDRYLASLEK